MSAVESNFEESNFFPSFIYNSELQHKLNVKDKAQLASLIKTMQDVLTQANTLSGNNKEKAVSNSNLNDANNDPSYADMIKMIGTLTELLGNLQVEIAKIAQQNSESNSAVGKGLMYEMQAKIKDATDKLNEIVEAEKKENIWSKVTEALSIVTTVLVGLVAIFTGQPELIAVALITATMTGLSVSGEMDKITTDLADGLEKMGVPKSCSKLVASILIVVITFAATIAVGGLAAGSGAGQVANAAEDGIEMTNMAADAAEEGAAEGEGAVDNAANDRPATALKSPKRIINLGLFSASQAVVNTNFAQYFADAVLSRMKDGKEKDALRMTITIIIDVLASLAAMGSGAAAFSGGANALSRLSTMTRLLKGIQGLRLASYAMQGTSQAMQSSIDFKLASDTQALAEAQATIKMLQSLLSSNNKQSQADDKAAAASLESHAKGIVTLTEDLNKASSALSQVLQA